ncbi:hypothetical protein LCGC14_2186940, partial [marine sediment metagenome]
MSMLKRRSSTSVGGIEIEIRQTTADALPQLDIHLPQGGPAKHADRLARQARGEAVYLIAWQGDRP